MVTKRIPILLLAGKWCVALALLLAMTLPFTTCKGQASYIEWKLENWATLLCFAWPVPLLIMRSIWKEVRSSWPVALFEMLLAAGAWCYLLACAAVAVALTFGTARLGEGFELATRALLAHFVLSIAELVTNVRSRPRRPSLQSTHVRIDQVPEPGA